MNLHDLYIAMYQDYVLLSQGHVLPRQEDETFRAFVNKIIKENYNEGKYWKDIIRKGHRNVKVSKKSKVTSMAFR